MQAYRLNDFGSFDHLAPADDERPVAGRGEVLVRVRAASLNYRDIAMAMGQYPLEHARGLVPLSDGAGEIVAVGTPEDVVREGRSYTGRYLAPLLGRGDLAGGIAAE